MRRYKMDDSTLKRFMDKVKTVGECWQWTGANTRKKNGYGVIRIGTTKILTHRLSWLHHKGEIPDSSLVLHQCDNSLCVRPDHLFLGTQQDNVTDMMNKNRRGIHDVSKGVDHFNSKLTPEIIKAIASDIRTQAEIAKQYNVSQSVISKIKLNQAWKHIERTNAQIPPHRRGHRKLCEHDIITIRHDKRTNVAIAKSYNISNQQVSNIKRRISWKDLYPDKTGEI
jgi:hypothetical protein